MRITPGSYLVRHFVSVLPVWIGISLLAFSLANLAPGDPAELLLRRQTGEPPTAEAVRELRQSMGLDRPFHVRYRRWMGRALRGDLGESYSTGAPVAHMLMQHIPATLQLALTSLLLGLMLGIPLGVVAAANRGSLLDHSSRFAALLGTSIPAFVLGYLLILLGSVTFKFFPVAGSGSWEYLVLPAITLGLAEAASLSRLTRASMIEVLGQDFVTTAHAKGLHRRDVTIRHALRNAMNPVITHMGLRFGRLLGGAVIVEVVFARAGLGTVVVDAIRERDYPVIQGSVLFIGTVFVATSLLVDLIYSRMDPRIRFGGRQEGLGVPG